MVTGRATTCSPDRQRRPQNAGVSPRAVPLAHVGARTAAAGMTGAAGRTRLNWRRTEPGSVRATAGFGAGPGPTGSPNCVARRSSRPQSRAADMTDVRHERPTKSRGAEFPRAATTTSSDHGANWRIWACVDAGRDSCAARRRSRHWPLCRPQGELPSGTPIVVAGFGVPVTPVREYWLQPRTITGLVSIRKGAGDDGLCDRRRELSRLGGERRHGVGDRRQPPEPAWLVSARHGVGDRRRQVNRLGGERPCTALRLVPTSRIVSTSATGLPASVS